MNARACEEDLCSVVSSSLWPHGAYEEKIEIRVQGLICYRGMICHLTCLISTIHISKGKSEK